MQVGKGNRILFLILLCLAVVFPGACTYKGGSGRVSEVQEFDSFFSTHSDSVVMAPRWMKAQALQRMERTKDSMVRYNYLAVALVMYGSMPPSAIFQIQKNYFPTVGKLGGKIQKPV